ncbi:hypothetical protein GCM10007919_40410 [Rhizobium indigoferae]|nr:hypothetical protein GCM10007919_40410 [Rhizobium indigoferae]
MGLPPLFYGDVLWSKNPARWAYIDAMHAELFYQCNPGVLRSANECLNCDRGRDIPVNGIQAGLHSSPVYGGS